MNRSVSWPLSVRQRNLPSRRRSMPFISRPRWNRSRTSPLMPQNWSVPQFFTLNSLSLSLSLSASLQCVWFWSCFLTEVWFSNCLQTAIFAQVLVGFRSCLVEEAIVYLFLCVCVCFWGFFLIFVLNFFLFLDIFFMILEWKVKLVLQLHCYIKNQRNNPVKNATVHFSCIEMFLFPNVQCIERGKT